MGGRWPGVTGLPQPGRRPGPCCLKRLPPGAALSPRGRSEGPAQPPRRVPASRSRRPDRRNYPLPRPSSGGRPVRALPSRRDPRRVREHPAAGDARRPARAAADAPADATAPGGRGTPALGRLSMVVSARGHTWTALGVWAKGHAGRGIGSLDPQRRLLAATARHQRPGARGPRDPAGGTSWRGRVPSPPAASCAGATAARAPGSSRAPTAGRVSCRCPGRCAGGGRGSRTTPACRR